MFGGGAGRGISGGGAGGGRPKAGMLLRCIKCFDCAGAWSEASFLASCRSAPVLVLECRTLGGERRPVPGTKDGVEEMVMAGRMEERKGAGSERTCTDAGRRRVWGCRACKEGECVEVSTAAAEGDRGGAVTERLAVRFDSDGLPELGRAEALR